MDYSMRSKERSIRRKKQVHTQRIIVCAAIAVLIILFSIIFGSRFAYADETESGMVSQKYFKSITIESGDTLESIASAYISSEYKNTSQYINEVKKMNRMLDDEIKTGNSLIIPYYEYTMTVAAK